MNHSQSTRRCPPHEAAQRLAVDGLGVAEVVNDPGNGAAGLAVALVVGELQVADH